MIGAIAPAVFHLWTSRASEPGVAIVQPRRHRHLPDPVLAVIAAAMGDPLTVSAQISLLVFMMIASKGAAGVTGAGLATLAGGLASHRPELSDGVGLIVGIDRFHVKTTKRAAN
jgi:hypothetical protein